MNEQLYEKIRHIANLPTLPIVASQLMRIVRDPETSAEDIASLVSQDVSLSAKILRLANSAFYGIPRSINSINNAVVILGNKIIQTMVLGLTVFDMFGDSSEESRLFDRNSFWIHSLKCATTAKLLAFQCRETVRLDPEEAFCAGLLHDVGKVVMEQYLHRDFHTVLRAAKDEKKSLFKVENDYLGYDHCDVAEWLTSTWSLPEGIEMSVIYHHSPDQAPQCSSEVTLCCVANWLSQSEPQTSYPPEITQKVEFLGLSNAKVEETMALLPEELKKAKIFLG
ncbi:MAG: HDOD domain-containing protein [Chitinispirillaceae bacterium]